MPGQERACIGWCFGGGWSLRLAMAAPDLDASVIYYGRLVTDAAKLKPIGARVLGVFGTQDRGIPPRSVRAFEAAMKEAKKDIQVLNYDANHAFANPSSARYDAKHAAAAWTRVRAFLREMLRPGVASRPAGKRMMMRARGLNVSYMLPATWSVKAKPGMMRNVDFTLEGAPDVQCYVTVLPGAAGGLGPNVNRWRAQLGEEPLDEDGIAGLESFAMLGTKAQIAEIDGAYTKRGGAGRVDDARLVGVVCSLDEQVVFVKLIGPRKQVQSQERAFRAFCASMRR